MNKFFYKNKFAKYFFVVMFMVCSILIFTSFVSAVGISVTRASLDFKDVLKGGYAEQTFYVGTDADFDIPISYELEGDVKDWIVVVPDLNNINSTVFVNNQGYKPVTIIVEPPSDIPSGTYSGGVRIITGRINNPEGQFGSQIQAAFLVRINVVVTGDEILACSAGGIRIKDTEIGNPLEYSMTVSNVGNIRVRPNVTIDVWNQDQTRIALTRDLTFNNVEVLPTTSRVFSNNFESNLRIGQYWAYVTVFPCETTELTTFNVYEKGALVDSGEFIRLDTNPWASVGDVSKVTAVFKNTGQRTVSAKFKGIVTLNNKVIQTIDTEFYDVASGETGNIEFYYTPKKLGQHVISGRILYNNKLSFEKSTAINVNSGSEETFNWLYVVIIVIILLIIGLLIRIINQKKKRIHRI